MGKLELPYGAFVEWHFGGAVLISSGNDDGVEGLRRGSEGEVHIKPPSSTFTIL